MWMVRFAPGSQQHSQASAAGASKRWWGIRHAPGGSSRVEPRSQCPTVPTILPDSQSWSLNLIAEQRHLFAFIPVYLA